MQNNIFQQISMGHFYYDYLAPSLTFIGRLHDSLDNFLIRCDIKPCKTLEDKTSGFILELNTLGYTDLFFFSRKLAKMFLDYQWVEVSRF